VTVDGAPRGGLDSESASREPPAPLFIDPVHRAPTDPTVVEAPDGTWWMFYTQRRAADRGPGFRWVHGTDIGVAVSADGGLAWDYRGVVSGLDPEEGRNTLWAPEVVRAEGRYHMFASYIRGVPTTWEGHPRVILHHVSDDLVDWRFLGEVPLSSDRVIDACVLPLPGGGYRMWFKDEAHASTTWAADSRDLARWTTAWQDIGLPAHEGPNVFVMGDRHWMVVDEWSGLGVYTSPDLRSWERDGVILSAPGARPWDASLGHHADVVIGRDSTGSEIGWVFYFTHLSDQEGTAEHRVGPSDPTGPADPDVLDDEGFAPAHQLTAIQVAALRVVDGHLVCNRDGPVDLDLRRASTLTAADPSPHSTSNDHLGGHR